MDVSGVDVDFLSGEEILELCSDIVDCKSEEISVLKGIDVNNLSDDKINELYDDVMYKKEIPESKVIKLTDRQLLDNNYNIIDEDKNEIVVLNGKNIDVNNLSDDEILNLYDDIIDQDLIAAWYITKYIHTSNCTIDQINANGSKISGYAVDWTKSVYVSQIFLTCYDDEGNAFYIQEGIGETDSYVYADAMRLLFDSVYTSTAYYYFSCYDSYYKSEGRTVQVWSGGSANSSVSYMHSPGHCAVMKNGVKTSDGFGAAYYDTYVVK